MMSPDSTKSDEKDRLINLIAAQYVLGTLSASTRMRFQQLMQHQPELLKLTHAWERRLNPLAQLLEPQAVPEVVWQRIEAVLDQLHSTSNAKSTSSLNAANDPTVFDVATDTITAPTIQPIKSQTYWKPFAWLSSAVAAGLMLFIVVKIPMLQTDPVPVMAQAQPVAIQDIAVLSDNEKQPAWIVRKQGNHLILQQLNAYSVPTQNDLELWSIAASPNAVPQSLGLVRVTDGKAVLSQAQTTQMSSDSILALSLEPKNGSPTGLPTGSVLYSGKVV